MKWEKLSLKDRTDLMKLYIQNGFTNLSEIKNHYNSFDNGGNMGGAYGEVPFTTDYSKVSDSSKKTITLDNLHELAKDNPALYKSYMQRLPKEYQAKVIENAARSRYGYEGLNNFMYSTTGGAPGLIIDYLGKSIGSGITALQGDSKNIFDSSNKGISEGITDTFRRKYPTISTITDTVLNTVPNMLLGKYIPDVTVGSTNINSINTKIDKEGLRGAYFTQRRNDTPAVKALLRARDKSSVKDLSKKR